MGKRILVRHRGKGGLQYRSPQVGKFAKVRYPFVPEGQTTEMKVLDIVHERGRAYPLAELDYSGKRFYIPAVSGTIVGTQIQIGPRHLLHLVTFYHSLIFRREQLFATLRDTWATAVD